MVEADPQKTFNLHEAKTHFSRLVDRAHAGEEIIVAKAGVPYAKLVPIEPVARPRRKPGGLTVTGPIDWDAFNEPLSDEELDRYARHIVLREVGGEGQLRLKAASVAVISGPAAWPPATSAISSSQRRSVSTDSPSSGVAPDRCPTSGACARAWRAASASRPPATPATTSTSP